MFSTRITSLLCGILLGSAASSYALDVIQLNGMEVEANSVLARLKDQQAGKVRAFNVPDAAVENHSALVPGLLTLTRQAGQIQALSVEEKAAALQKWIDDLRATGQFEYVAPNYIRHANATPNDVRFQDGTLWSLNNFGQNGGIAGADISATRAWDVTTGSTNVIVAVIDSGVRYTHRDLNAQMWQNPNEIPGNGIDDDNDGFVDDVYGINAMLNTGDPMDDFGHGTHVAGTIGAAANDGNPHVGVAWQLRIMALKFLGSNNSGSDSDAIRCINYAATHGAKIINASWGGYGNDPALFDAINALRSKGVLFVASAANDNNDNDANPAYPASYKLDNIISVAASDRRDLMASFSNFGRNSVHLAAPGVEIFSTYFNSDSDYTFLQGTSMAAPHVSGVAALVAAFLPGGSYTEIRSRILEGVDRVPSMVGKTITGGRLNAFKALTRGIDNILEYSVIPATNSFLSIGQRTLFSVSISDGPIVTNATVTLATPGGTNLSLIYDASGNSPTAGSYTNSYLVPDVQGPISFTLTATAPGKSNLVVQLPYTAVNRPANDNFADAIKVPQQLTWTHETSNRLATIEGPAEARLSHGGVTNASASIWYSWSVRERTSVIVDTAGSSFDTAIGVYQGNSLETLEEVASADDIGARKEAWVKFVAEPGINYKVAIAGVPPDDQGRVQVRFELNGEPDTVRPILQVTSPVSGITTRSNKITISGVAFDPQPNASGIADAGVKYSVNTNLVQNPNELPTSAEGTTNWTAIVSLNEGVNFVRIWALDNAENKSAESQVAIIFRQPLSANDFFFDRITLSSNSSSRVDSNTNATKEFHEPAHAGNPGGKSIWYQFTAPTSGVLLVSTRGSDFDTLLGVYVSTNAQPRVTTLDEVGSSDDVPGAGKFSEVSVPVNAGQTYYIAVDGFDAASGTVQLTYTFSAMAVRQLTILPSIGNGTVTPRSGPYPVNSTVTVTARPGPNSQFDYFETPNGQVRSNPLTVAISNDVSIRAVFRTRSFAEDFQGGLHLPFLSTNWTIGFDPTNRANQVFASAGNRQNSLTNTASVVVRTVEGVGSFDFGVSTETNYDRLEFYVSTLQGGQPTNTVLLGSWSGEMRGRYNFALPAGTIRLEWRYLKDRAISAGLDTVFIDNIDLPLAAGLAGLSVKDTTISLNVSGLEGQTVQIEASNDLQNWTAIGSALADENGIVRFDDGAAAPRRFYRFIPAARASP